MNHKHLVVSAVNFSEGGPLTILLDCLASASSCLPPEWTITALVHDRRLIPAGRVQCLEFPQAKTSWIKRLWLEWFHFNSLSKRIQPDLWLSLHDITPRVKSRRQIVYCHNPAPFYKPSLRELQLEPKFLLFNLFYGWLYRLNIHANHAVIVQQEWLRREFQRRMRHSNIIVAHPALHTQHESTQSRRSPENKKIVFLYPALARTFKNHALLCEASSLLPPDIQKKIEIRLTLDGTENRYAADIKQKYSKSPAIRFIGRQNRVEMGQNFLESDVVLFPSKLETWGLPITEAKALNKPLLVSDLPYARETVGTYAKAAFLSADSTTEWARAIEDIVRGDWTYKGQVAAPPKAPYAEDWRQLWQLLTKDL